MKCNKCGRVVYTTTTSGKCIKCEVNGHERKLINDTCRKIWSKASTCEKVIDLGALAEILQEIREETEDKIAEWESEE